MRYGNLDIRNMRPEKQREGVVVWRTSSDEYERVRLWVANWAVRSDGAWTPAVRFKGRWYTPESFAASWPRHVLYIARPGEALPHDDLLMDKADSLAGSGSGVRWEVGPEPNAEQVAAWNSQIAREDAERAAVWAAWRAKPDSDGWYVPPRTRHRRRHLTTTRSGEVR